MSDLDRNKEKAPALCDLMLNQCRPRQAIQRFARTIAEGQAENPVYWR
jgi:hypothetical protein